MYDDLISRKAALDAVYEDNAEWTRDAIRALPADYDRIRQLEADLAATLAANAALVQRLEEARGLVELAMPQLWHDATLVRARAFLAGGAA